MAISVSELKRWLETLEDSSLVWIEEGGIALANKGDNYEAYLEVGGEADGN